MFTSEALKVYKTRKAIAEALQISESAVYQWDEMVPPLSAAKLAKRSKGRLKFDPDRYDTWNARRAVN
jgi:hypothetical protein